MRGGGWEGRKIQFSPYSQATRRETDTQSYMKAMCYILFSAGRKIGSESVRASIKSLYLSVEVFGTAVLVGNTTNH